MPVLLAVAALALAACTSPAPAPASPLSPPDSAMTLFIFDGEAEPRWSVVNDGVMGGRSQGYVEVDGGTLSFTGTLVTRGGGFTSVRVPMRRDLSDYAAVEMRVRGGGRTFEVEVDDGTRSRRGIPVSRRGAFPTTEDWQIVRVAFEELETTAFGEPVSVAPLAPEAVRSLGLYIVDGIDGPFRLEVDWIRAVG